jgi:hypothetical protein
MQAREYIEALVRIHPETALADVLAADAALLARVRELPVGFSWETGSADGWYLLEDGGAWHFRWQERGAAVHRRTFKSLADAIAWAYQERVI